MLDEKEHGGNVAVNDNKLFSFGLTRIDRMLVEALRYSLEIIMPDIMSDYNLTDRNGFGQFRWNAIMAQLREKCNALGWMYYGTCKRGPWKTPVLFHTDSRYIFTFMTEETFHDVQKRKNKGEHYLCGCASYNVNVYPTAQQMEMDIPKVDNDSQMWIAKSREQLAEAVEHDVGQICGHILVLFNVKNDTLVSVRAVRLTADLAISTEEENWTKYIRLPYESTETVVPQNTVDDDNDDILVELK